MTKIIELKKEKEYDEKNLKQVLSYAMFEPTEEKIQEKFCEYMRSQNTHIFYVIQNKEICGVVVVEETNENKIIMKNIGVKPEYRNKKIGSFLINSFSFIEKFKNNEIIAETDNDSVKFYEKIGFTVEKKELEYLGIERYICRKIT